MAGAEAPSFSVVVPTFRRPDALAETLAGLMAQTYERSRYEVIVVDDAASPETDEIVERFRGQGVALTLERQQRRGAATARNRGARTATGELLLLCDDDMLLAPTHLALHAAAHQRHPMAMIGAIWEFAPRVEHALRQTAFGRYRIMLEHRHQADVAGQPLPDDPACLRMPLLGSGIVSVSRALFWQVGGFDEAFPVAGAEDQDFSIRARQAGAQLLLDTRIRCRQNDNRITLQSYCEREERSARTVAVLLRKHPSELQDTAYVRENTPIRREDPPALILKKALKAALSRRQPLRVLHEAAAVAERLRMPERALRRLYRVLLGLHLHRGFRGGYEE